MIGARSRTPSVAVKQQERFFCCQGVIPRARTRLARRETLRDAVLRWTTPFCAVRAMIGSASFNAAAAASLLPEAMASSTLRTELLRRGCRAPLCGLGRE